LPVSQYWAQPVYANSLWVIGPNSISNIINTSSNGTTWTAATLSNTQYWTQPVYANSLWVIGAYVGTIVNTISSFGASVSAFSIPLRAATLGATYYVKT
jgi:hypothetical protein